LGKLEIELMERLAGEGRSFCVVVTRLEGESEKERAEFRAEIEEHKVGPLRRELGPFEVFYSLEGLEAWVCSRLEASHLGQLRRGVARGVAALRLTLEARAAEERKIEARLDFLAGHLEDQAGRLRDLVSQERMAVENRVLEAAGEDLAARLETAPRELTSRVRERFAGQIREFSAAYQELLPPFEFDPQAELGSPGEVSRIRLPEALEDLAADGQRLEREAEALLSRLERHVRAHVEHRRASLRAAGRLSRLAELAAEADRALAGGGP
jgi:hypothetical protein